MNYWVVRLLFYLVLGVILYVNHDHALLLLLSVYGLFMINDKIILLIGTWSLTRKNSVTTRVEWDALGQLMRKARERSPYPKGAREEVSLQSIVLGVIFAMGLQTVEQGICSLRLETVVSSLKLVELWKGLVVLPCLASVELYGIHDLVADRITTCG
jgi:hypothetical protein